MTHLSKVEFINMVSAFQNDVKTLKVVYAPLVMVTH